MTTQDSETKSRHTFVTARRGFVTSLLGVAAWLAGAVLGPGFRVSRAEARESDRRSTEFGAENWLGEIVAVPYNFAPRGFVFCEGQELQIQQNQSLFSLIGTFYGGDGRRTFKLPDTRPLEADAKKKLRAQRPPFRYVIALAGNFPSRA